MKYIIGVLIHRDEVTSAENLVALMEHLLFTLCVSEMHSSARFINNCEKIMNQIYLVDNSQNRGAHEPSFLVRAASRAELSWSFQFGL